MRRIHRSVFVYIYAICMHTSERVSNIAHVRCARIANMYAMHTEKRQIVVYHGIWQKKKSWKLAQIFLHYISSENTLIVSLFPFSSFLSFLFTFLSHKRKYLFLTALFFFICWKIHLLRHVLSESLLRRNISISQLAIYELPGTSDLSKFFIRMSLYYITIDTWTGLAPLSQRNMSSFR